ncbi:MAG: phage scaffolding protein [Bacteroidaceae bacterium]|nr:phage scaffolding protein [Bacteroidaceae bacterium]
MALEWLKTVLGTAYTEDIDKKVSEEIGKGFVARSDFNSVNEAKKTLEGQIVDRDKQLEELKKVDSTKLQDEITRLQGENTTNKTNYEKQLAELKLGSALDVALLGAKALDVKAVKPFINMELIKLDGDKVLGLEEQLKTIKESKSFLFEGEKEPPKSGGMRQTGSEGSEDKKEEANAALRSAFGRE